MSANSAAWHCSHSSFFWGVVAQILWILADMIDIFHKMLKKIQENHNLKIVSKNIYKCL